MNTRLWRAKCPHADLRIFSGPKRDNAFDCPDCEEPVQVVAFDVEEVTYWRLFDEHGEPCVPDFDLVEDARAALADMRGGDEPNGERIVRITRRTLRKVA